MIRTISIENFKSISKLELELGRVNVLIGANGSGKSNILEAITFGSAAEWGMLANEFLVNRGIRVSDPRMMYCGFDKAGLDLPIGLAFTDDYGKTYRAELRHQEGVFSGWIDIRAEPINEEQIFGALSQPLVDKAEAISLTVDSIKRFQKALEEDTELLRRIVRKRAGDMKKLLLLSIQLGGFLVYTPQLSTLRQLWVDGAIEPLGIHGEGLFRLLRVLQDQGHLDEIKKAMKVIDGFEDFELAGDATPVSRQIRIVDQFLDPSFIGLDHLSANEGFLFFLFYMALLISPDTPRFFAVDNIDESLNPKLSAQLIREIVRLAQKYDKQTLLTTHNPATLDGLDLSDEDQRLFVVYRNIDGHTCVERILPRDGESAGEIRLSEAFIRGYLGGLPNNF